MSMVQLGSSRYSLPLGLGGLTTPPRTGRGAFWNRIAILDEADILAISVLLKYLSPHIAADDDEQNP
jgi:hypothetical protein